jgi:hypothetical protein
MQYLTKPDRRRAADLAAVFAVVKDNNRFAILLYSGTLLFEPTAILHDERIVALQRTD